MSVLQLTIFLAAAALSGSSVVKPASEDTFELLILHNNDMHARFEQTSQLSGTCTTEDREKGKCYGGFPRVAHVVKEARKAAASGEGPPVLYLNAGDTYTGTAWFTIYKWKIAAEFINALQPDAVSLGNNELEKGNKISPFLENIKTNILASNVRLNSGIVGEKLQKSLIIDISGRKVGVIGFLTSEDAALDIAAEYTDEVSALKEETAKLKANNINIIIALGHCNTEKCIEIAKEVEGLDLIISGYKNIFNSNGTSAITVVEKPKLVSQKSGKTVPIFQSYTYSEILGKLTLNFNANGDLTEFNADSILLDTNVPQDPEALTLYKRSLRILNNDVVGQTAVVLDGDSCKTQECNLGNLITDSMMYMYALNYDDERWTDAPIALIPGGAIASSISPTNRPAPVTTSDLQSAIFTSNIVAVLMNGTVLNEVLEHSVASYDQARPTGEFLQFSGIRVVYDMEKPPGERVLNTVARCWDCGVPQYYSIDNWRTYKVLMPSSVANGEYGYNMLENLAKQDFDRDEVTVTSEFIKLRGLVYPEVAGRIELINLPDSPNSGMSVSYSLTILILTIISLVIA